MSRYKLRLLEEEIKAFRLGYDEEPEWFTKSDKIINYCYSKDLERSYIACEIMTEKGNITVVKGEYIVLDKNNNMDSWLSHQFEKVFQKI